MKPGRSSRLQERVQRTLRSCCPTRSALLKWTLGGIVEMEGSICGAKAGAHGVPGLSYTGGGAVLTDPTHPCPWGRVCFPSEDLGVTTNWGTFLGVF